MQRRRNSPFNSKNHLFHFEEPAYQLTCFLSCSSMATEATQHAPPAAHGTWRRRRAFTWQRRRTTFTLVPCWRTPPDTCASQIPDLGARPGEAGVKERSTQGPPGEATPCHFCVRVCACLPVSHTHKDSQTSKQKTGSRSRDEASPIVVQVWPALASPLQYIHGRSCG